ncbi:guanine nucleotide-binding protein alpha-2 subunit [[Candida] anglica]|uniref:Guanine nucleotide-binding protein alpha-2 subunit n=1 Tax=[Candida] anglica TaxID=148631 RepID=A0ABP0ELQ6_9ASCO
MGSCLSKGPEPKPTPSKVNSKPSNGKITAEKRQDQKAALNAGSNGNANATSNGSKVETPIKSTGQSDSGPTVSTSNGTSNIKESLSDNPTSAIAANNGNSNIDGLDSNGSSDKQVKVLLLGSGESGKSTIVKQMKILHQNGYSKDEIIEYKPFVYRNVLECIKNIINAIIDLEPQLIKNEADSKLKAVKSLEGVAIDGDATLSDTQSQESLQGYENGKPASRREILNYDDLNKILDYEFTMNTEDVFDANIAQLIINVYNTPEVRDFVKFQQGNFYLIDSTHYFLKDVKRIAAPGYIPSVNDILRTRKKTSGIFDFKFQMSSGLNIHMYDVGGQRSERKKWIHCFDNVTLIIFCVALSEYDQVLLEENSQNRLEESLTLFDSVVNSRWFSRTSIVLFLNKIDVFAEKLPYSPLENHFPDYTGGNNINKAAKYILWRFTQVNRSGLNIFPHVTQATDTSNIQLVFAAVKETILENSLRDSGLL